MRWIMSWMRGVFPRGYVFTNTSLNYFWQQVSSHSKTKNAKKKVKTPIITDSIIMYEDGAAI